MMTRQPAGATRQREAARRDDETTRGRRGERQCNNQPVRREDKRGARGATKGRGRVMRDATTSCHNELTRGWRNERTARGNATTSWRDKTTRGQRNKRTGRGDTTTSWRDELTRGRHNERTTRSYMTTSWHDEVTRGRRDKRRHSLVVFRVQMKSTGKVAAMVVACIVQKPEKNVFEMNRR